MVGRAQRYVAEVKAEVNRSIELEELKKMREQFEDAARDVHTSVAGGLNEATDAVNAAWTSQAEVSPSIAPPMPAYRRPRKNWRLKRSAVPGWYKQRERVRTHAQSGAARVARFRPSRGVRT
jgi:sec-independent protein translocase protein TatB